jgi:hypothetical protein
VPKKSWFAGRIKKVYFFALYFSEMTNDTTFNTLGDLFRIFKSQINAVKPENRNATFLTGKG